MVKSDLDGHDLDIQSLVGLFLNLALPMSFLARKVSKCLQKSSTETKISVILSVESIANFLANYLNIKHLNILNYPLLSY